MFLKLPFHSLKNIFNSGELDQNAVIRKFRITASEGKSYETKHYNLDTTILVGYWANSVKVTQFRQWVILRLRPLFKSDFDRGLEVLEKEIKGKDGQ